jgi:hypothetical protein
MKRLPRVLWIVTPAGRRAAEGAPEERAELAEDIAFREAEPNETRFARLETKTRQRLKVCATPISEVRMASASLFETWKKSGAHVAPLEVRNGKMAEHMGCELRHRSALLTA